jgi:hypothetical protein
MAVKKTPTSAWRKKKLPQLWVTCLKTLERSWPPRKDAAHRFSLPKVVVDAGLESSWNHASREMDPRTRSFGELRYQWVNSTWRSCKYADIVWYSRIFLQSHAECSDLFAVITPSVTKSKRPIKLRRACPKNPVELAGDLSAWELRPNQTLQHCMNPMCLRCPFQQS